MPSLDSCGIESVLAWANNSVNLALDNQDMLSLSAQVFQGEPYSHVPVISSNTPRHFFLRSQVDRPGSQGW